jgi:murein DD-endopeptidase MepM/ murein hydrolase activator NlpD
VRSLHLALLFFILFMLSACGQSKSTANLNSLLLTASPEVKTSAPTFIPATPVSTARIVVNFTPTPREDLPHTTLTRQVDLQACSPLQDHSWKDLSEIVTNPFDPPPPGKDSGHQGVDFAYYRRGNRLSIEGVQIDSVLSGTAVAVVHNRPPYGNMVIIETYLTQLPVVLNDFLGMTPGESVYLLYAHMRADPSVSPGQQVTCGEKLGEVGNTPPGWSSAPHLHLEVRVGPSGAQFSSMAYYDNSITMDEKSNYERWRMSGTFRMLDPLRLLDLALNP